MAKSIVQLVAEIDAFQPIDDWRPLDDLIGELFKRGGAGAGIDAMLRVFERFPDEDGAGVFWSIIHALESIDEYEPRLIEAFRRAPTEFSLIMMIRLINAGIEKIGAISLVEVVREVSDGMPVDSETRSLARKFLLGRSAK